MHALRRSLSKRPDINVQRWVHARAWAMPRPLRERARWGILSPAVMTAHLASQRQRWFFLALGALCAVLWWRVLASHPELTPSFRAEIALAVCLSSLALLLGGLALRRQTRDQQHAEAAEREQRVLAEALRDTAAALSSTLDLNDVLDRIIENVGRVVPHDSVEIMSINMGAAHIMRHHAHVNVDQKESLAHVRLVVDETPNLRRMVRTGEPVVVPDTRADPGWIVVPGAAWIRSYAGAPLCLKGEVVGFLGVASATPGFFTDDHAARLKAFSDQAAVAMSNAHLFQETQQALRESQLLNRVVSAATSILDVGTALQGIVEEMVYAFSTERAGAALLSADRGAITVAAAYPLDGASSIIGMTMNLPRAPEIDVLLNELAPVAITDAQVDPRVAFAHPLMKQFGVASLLLLPIALRDSVVGVLGLATNQRREFSADQMILARNVAAATSQALENAQLYSQSLQRASEFAALLDVANDLAAQRNLSSVLDTIVARATALLAAPIGAIFLYDHVSKNLTAAIWRAPLSSPVQHIAMGQGLTGRVARTRQAMIVNDYKAWPHRLPEMEHMGVTAAIAVPMICRGDLVGVLLVGDVDRQERTFTEGDARLMSLFGSLAAEAVSIGRMIEESQRRIRELEAINTVSTALRTAQTVNDILTIALDETLSALKTNAGRITLYDSTTSAVQEIVARGWPAEIAPLRPGEGIAGSVFNSGQPYVAREIRHDERTRQDLRDLIPEGWGGAYIPVMAADKVIGVLFAGVQLPRTIEESDLGLLKTIAEVAGTAIQRTRLHDETERNVRRLAALHTVDTAMTTSHDLREILSVIIEQAVAQLGVDAADILMLDAQTQLLVYVAGSGRRKHAPGMRVLLTQSLAGLAALEQRMISIPDVREAGDLAQLIRKTLPNEGVVAYVGVPLITKGQVKGVLEIFHCSPLTPGQEWLNFCQTLADQAAVAIDNSTLFADIERSNTELRRAYEATIEGWSRALSLRDRETEIHTQRVTDLTLRLARVVGIPEDDLIHVRRGSLLHDIGKMAVPDNVLFKPGPLSEEEWCTMRRHPVHAYELLSRIPYLRPALDIPYCHHERWDGSGYPQGLKGEAIPLAARVFAVIDVWDSVTSDRPYHKAWPAEEAVAYLRDHAGDQFDPDVVRAFLEQVLPAVLS